MPTQWLQFIKQTLMRSITVKQHLLIINNTPGYQRQKVMAIRYGLLFYKLINLLIPSMDLYQTIAWNCTKTHLEIINNMFLWRQSNKHQWRMILLLAGNCEFIWATPSMSQPNCVRDFLMILYRFLGFLYFRPKKTKKKHVSQKRCTATLLFRIS